MGKGLIAPGRDRFGASGAPPQRRKTAKGGMQSDDVRWFRCSPPVGRGGEHKANGNTGIGTKLAASLSHDGIATRPTPGVPDPRKRYTTRILQGDARRHRPKRGFVIAVCIRTLRIYYWSRILESLVASQPTPISIISTRLQVQDLPTPLIAPAIPKSCIKQHLLFRISRFNNSRGASKRRRAL